MLEIVLTVGNCKGEGDVGFLRGTRLTRVLSVEWLSNKIYQNHSSFSDHCCEKSKWIWEAIGC